MYPKNSASPPKIFATVVKAADGTAITSGVAAKYSTGAGSQAAGGGTCQGEGNGQWSYAPTQAETNVDGFGIQFYHADAVGSGPTVSVVTSASVVQTGDSYARIGAPVGASISADIAVIEAQTDDIGIAGAGLTAIPWNASWDAEVQSEATDALNAYDPPTNAEMEARTLVAASYFDPAADTVANVTTVGSVTGAVGSVTGAVGSVTGAVGSVTGNVGGNVAGSVGSVTGAVGSVTGNVGGNVTGSVGSLATQAKADVNAEVVDALATDVIADSVAADGSRPTIAQALLMITRFLMEKGVVSTTATVYKEDGTTSSMTFTLDSATVPTAITRAS